MSARGSTGYPGGDGTGVREERTPPALQIEPAPVQILPWVKVTSFEYLERVTVALRTLPS